MSSNRIYGIDLGTTYSCVARVDEHGRPEVIPNQEGASVTPSVVYFESESNVVVGQSAKEEALLHPELVQSMVKRCMGDPNAIFNFHGTDYRPEEISAYILKKLAADAEQITGEPVEDVVITCPAYFGVSQRKATKHAGEIAGLKVHYVIPEPTAAAIAYGLDSSDEEVIVVYDLGGGTFDATLIEISDTSIMVKSVDGDDRLGGEGWDRLIVGHFASQASAEIGGDADDLLDDPEVAQNLLADAEDAKISLSSREAVTKVVRCDEGRAKVEITRPEFEDLSASLLERATSLTRKVFDRAKELGHDRIHRILLVGGSTYMPQVRRALEPFGTEVQALDPNLIVAKGAAIFGHKCMLEEQIKIAIADEIGCDPSSVDLDQVEPTVREKASRSVSEASGWALPAGLIEKQIGNATAKSFGIVVQNESGEKAVSNLVQKDDPVPCEVSRSFGTLDEGQTSAELRCMENLTIVEADGYVPLDMCTEVGQAVLDFGKPLPQGSEVAVTFSLGPDGQLNMRGRDPVSGNDAKATFETDSIMTSDQVEAARSRALKTQVT